MSTESPEGLGAIPQALRSGGQASAPGPSQRELARIFVPGEPRAQGSKRAFVVKGRAVMTEMAKGLGPWRADIKRAASEVDYYVDKGPLSISLGFILPRPKSASKKLSGFALAAKRPDIDKLTRAVLDALTAVWYRDDAQIVELQVTKEVAMEIERPGVTIQLRSIVASP